MLHNRGLLVVLMQLVARERRENWWWRARLFHDASHLQLRDAFERLGPAFPAVICAVGCLPPQYAAPLVRGPSHRRSARTSARTLRSRPCHRRRHRPRPRSIIRSSCSPSAGRGRRGDERESGGGAPLGDALFGARHLIRERLHLRIER